VQAVATASLAMDPCLAKPNHVDLQQVSPDTRLSQRSLQFKGTVATVQWRSQSYPWPKVIWLKGSSDKLRKRLARWYELQRLLVCDASDLSFDQQSELHNLA